MTGSGPIPSLIGSAWLFCPSDRFAIAESATKDLTAVKAKISADLNVFKANMQRAKHKVDIKVAQMRADDLEWEAGFAIDYAIASIEQAGFAVLDAIEARKSAEQAKAA